MSAIREEAALDLLVVDDDAPIREALAFHLRRVGYRPVLAEDGDRAWELLQGEPERFLAVLLDRTMPRMDGMEVLARIKEHETLRTVPVILQTALTRKEEVLEGLEAGAYYYLTKPFDKKTLLAVVRTAVADRQAYLRLREETRRSEATLALMVKGVYVFRTVEEGRRLAAILARCSSDPDRMVLGLSELLVNAVEHGNLGISYDDKGRLLEEGGWEGEVARRLALPENLHKQVIVEFERRDGELRFRILDQGEGFDWRKYVTFAPERAFDNHGRGIALSRELSFDRLRYVGRGNEVIAVRREALSAGSAPATPAR